jgi:hypothetical protein
MGGREEQTEVAAIGVQMSSGGATHPAGFLHDNAIHEFVSSVNGLE